MMRKAELASRHQPMNEKKLVRRSGSLVQLLLPVPANQRPRDRVQVSGSTVTTVSGRDCLLAKVVGVTAARPGG